MNKYLLFIEEHGKPFSVKFMAPFSLFLIDYLKLMERFPRSISKIHTQITSLYGAKKGRASTKMYLAQLISIELVCFVIFLLLAIVNNGDGMILMWGGFIIILIPLIMNKDLEKKIRKRKQVIILELPLLLNKITLLVNAGESVQKAMIRSFNQRKDALSHPLYAEFIPLVNQIENNYSFPQAMEELSIRCGVQEVSIFTNTVLLNYRRGGAEFVTALRSLSHQLWETRKSITKTLGEEASSKLVFPLVMIFIVVMVIVASPAILLMG